MSGERVISIPDKLYAAAKAEGYEAGMRDAARICADYAIPADKVSLLLRDAERRQRVLAELVEG